MAMALARLRSPSPFKFRDLGPHIWPLCWPWKSTQILYQHDWQQTHRALGLLYQPCRADSERGDSICTGVPAALIHAVFTTLA